MNCNEPKAGISLSSFSLYIRPLYIEMHVYKIHLLLVEEPTAYAIHWNSLQFIGKLEKGLSNQKQKKTKKQENYEKMSLRQGFTFTILAIFCLFLLPLMFFNL